MGGAQVESLLYTSWFLGGGSFMKTKKQKWIIKVKSFVWDESISEGKSNHRAEASHLLLAVSYG